MTSFSDAAFQKAILDEMQLFESELKTLKQRSATLKVNIGMLDGTALVTRWETSPLGASFFYIISLSALFLK